MSQPSVNQLSAELLGIAALNPFLSQDSSSRLAMMCSHIGQSLVVKGATVRRTLTGVEREYGKYTHSIRMPCNAVILKCIDKYPRTIGADSVSENPIRTVIYENADSPRREIGILQLTRFHSVHQYYGFKYTYKPALEKLVPGAHIAKGTIIADSPTITEEGDYRYGLEAQMALMSMPPVIEDGVIASDAFLKRMTTMGFGSRTASWGKNRYPLNLYGDANNYKPFPDIGDRVREDGLLFAMRSYDELLAVNHMTSESLRTVDHFDKTIYAQPGAKIVDVIIHKGNQLKTRMPSGMEDQCMMYYRKTRAYHEALLAEYHSLQSKLKNTLTITPEFQRLLVESHAVTNSDPRNRVQHTFNRSPIDEWLIEVVFEYEVTPTIGFKLTDLHGGKGVICDVMKEEDMPVDALGNRAELVMDDKSTIKRMNIGRLTEQYICASGYATQKRLATLLGNRSDLEVEAAWHVLMGFYKTVSPRMFEAVMASGTDQRKLQHLEDVVKNGMYLYMPTDSPSEHMDIVRQLRQNYPAQNGPVTYRGKSGRVVTTKDNIIIGGMYMVLLEKTGNTWAAVSSAKLQHFGIPAKLTNVDKYAFPVRLQPVRIIGESEGRLFAAVSGGDTVAELLDQTNNPQAHKFILNTLLHADKPTAIEMVIDRNAVPRGKGRILTFVNHVLECAGTKFTAGDNVNA